MIFDYRVRVSTHDVHFIQALYTYYYRAEVASGRDRYQIANDLADVLLLPNDWAFFLRHLMPFGTFLRNFEVSTVSGLDLVTRQLGGPDYEGTRFFLGPTLCVSFITARIRWLVDNVTSVHYSQFSYLWELDWDGDYLTGLVRLLLRNFADAHARTKNSPHGDSFIPCVRIKGGILRPIVGFRVDEKFSRQLHRRKRV